MQNQIQLTKRSKTELAEMDDFRRFCPNIDEFSTISDFGKIREFGLAGRILVESQYFIVAEFLRTERWNEIQTAKIHCFDCETVELIKTIVDEDQLYTCPYCNSENIIAEAVPAFESESDFLDWSVEELDVSKRTIKLRKEYISKYLDIDLDVEDAFNGIAKWGVSWMFLTRRVEQKVKQEAMSIEDAQNVLANPDSFIDKGNVKRFQKKLEEKDDVEIIASPESPDMVLQIVDPDGDIRFQIYYIAIPVYTEGEELNEDNFWETAIGQMVAKKFKIMSKITYSRNLDTIPSYGFYEEWERKVKLFSIVRDIVRKLVNKTDKYEDILDSFSLRTGIINKIGYLLEISKRVISTGLEDSNKKIESLEEDIAVR